MCRYGGSRRFPRRSPLPHRQHGCAHWSDQDTGAFRLRYELEPATQGLATEIYLSEGLNYNDNSYEVTVVNAEVKKVEKNRLEVRANVSSGTVDVAITRPYI